MSAVPPAPLSGPLQTTSPLQRRPSTTDKTALLSALAEELKSEKIKAENAAKEMVHFEHLIEEKHSAFLSEQDRLTRQRDRNNVEIANLRRKLKELKKELEEAQNVKEEEAQLYLELLDEGGGGRSPAFMRSEAMNDNSLGMDLRDFGPDGKELYDPALEGHLRRSEVSEGHYAYPSSTGEQALRSPAPYPQADSQVKGLVSPQLHPSHDSYLHSYGGNPSPSSNEADKSDWFDHQEMSGLQKSWSRKILNTWMRKGSSKE